MATTFPTSVQTFTAPGADDSMNAVPAVVHHTLHDTIGDTLEAVQERAFLLPHITDAGIAADGTDQTSAINTWLGGLSPSIEAAYLIPPGVKFDPGSVILNMPPGLVFIDFSSINSFSSPGETTKRFGILSADIAESDTHWSIESGHHSVLTLNNYGTSGTASAAERLSSILWAVGRYATGSTDKRGFRGAAIETYRKAADGNYWERSLRTLAPWVAIDAEFEEWGAGVAATSGATYIISNAQIYVAASTGTTGATAPTHTSGTVSDGGVSWTWVDSGDRTLLSVDEYGRVKLNGGGGSADTLSVRQSITDAAAAAQLRITPRGATKTGRLLLECTDGSAAVVSVPYIEAENSGSLRIRRSDGSGNIAEFSDAGGFSVNEFRVNGGTAADGDTTPSVSGVSTMFLANTGATSISALDDGSDGQIVTLVALNGNTTLVHSVTFMLTGSANIALTTYSTVTFQKVPNSISDRWIEVSRSIK